MAYYTPQTAPHHNTRSMWNSIRALCVANTKMTMAQAFAWHAECVEVGGKRYFMTPDSYGFLRTLPFVLNDMNIPVFIFPDNSTIDFSPDSGVHAGLSIKPCEDTKQRTLLGRIKAFLDRRVF